MLVSDNIIKHRLKNVYFIWGRGKTTIANELHRKYGYYVYDVDEARNRHWRNADPIYQPYMCRDYEKEYGVSDFWQLPPEVIADRETHWLNEFTPMVVVDLIELAQYHDIIICEGDVDCDIILPVATSIVYLSNHGTRFDWFNRPDHADSLDSIKNRTDLTEIEKEEIIKNAYNSVGQNMNSLPIQLFKHGIKNIIWDDNTTIEQTAFEVAQYFNFQKGSNL